jgi:hypothetical protein
MRGRSFLATGAAAAKESKHGRERASRARFSTVTSYMDKFAEGSDDK